MGIRITVARPLATLVSFLRRENLLRLAGVIVVLVLAGAAGLTWFEEDRPFPDAVWWAIVTLTTVGFGDIAPVSLGGRLIGVVLMFFGIGVLGTFTATIAGVFVEKRSRRDRGMEASGLRKHIILCGWNDRTREILKDLRADSRGAGQDIVLLADVETRPVEDEQLHFVRGDVDEESLKRAGLERAATVVLVGDRGLDYQARDAKAVLAVLTVKSINPKVYAIVELAGEDNVRHCKQARADEIIVGADLCSRVISTATLDHGISTVVRELLSAQEGQNLITVKVTAAQAGRTFLELFCELKRDKGRIALAIQRGGKGGRGGTIVTNPEADARVEADDRLVVIAPQSGAGTSPPADARTAPAAGA